MNLALSGQLRPSYSSAPYKLDNLYCITRIEASVLILLFKDDFSISFNCDRFFEKMKMSKKLLKSLHIDGLWLAIQPNLNPWPSPKKQQSIRSSDLLPARNGSARNGSARNGSARNGSDSTVRKMK